MKVRAALASVLVLGALGTAPAAGSLPAAGSVPAVVPVAASAPVAAPAPAPAADGIVATTSSPTTGLDGGETVVVEVSGLAPGTGFRLGQCAEDDAATCAGDPHVADASGGLTVPFEVSGWVYLVPATGQPRITPCRPPGGCSLIAWRLDDGAVVEQDSIALGFTGSQIEATFTPTTDLVDGQVVSIAGRSGGAAGSTVEIRQVACTTTTCLVDEVLNFTTIGADDTFAVDVAVRRLAPRNGGGTFDCGAPTDGIDACRLFAFVQEPDGRQDESRGDASAPLQFRPTTPFQVRIIATTVWEGTGGARNAVVQIRLSAPQPVDVFVSVRTVDGTAKAPSDYGRLPLATVRFRPGQTLARLQIPIVTDARNEPDERFFVRGVEVTGGGTFAWMSSAVTIRDND